MFTIQTRTLSRADALRQIRLLSGRDLRPLADQYHVTVWKNGHKNKGWAGQVIEQYLGLPQNSRQAPDFGTWELKVVPLYYHHEDGIPRQWIAMMKRAIQTLAPQYNSDRMVEEYARKIYG